MKKIIKLFFILVCLSSCKKYGANILMPLNGKVTDSIKGLEIQKNVPSLSLNISDAVNIPVPEHPTPFLMDDYISSYRYIHLETTDESLIGTISKLCVDSSFIFIFDRQNNGVFRFSKEGKFLGRIGRKGRGPSEFIELYDMSLDNYRREVCLLDLTGGKLLYYNYGGKYLREEPVYYYYTGLEFLDDKMVLSTAFSHNKRLPAIDLNRLVITRRDQQPLFKGFPYPDALRENFHWEDARPLMKVGNTVYFHHILSDTIWSVRDSSCTAEYVLKFQGRDNLFTPKELSQLSDESYSKRISSTKYFLGIYLQSRDFLLLNISGDYRIVEPLIYCKSSGNILYGRASSASSANSLCTRLLYNIFDFTFEDGSFIKVLQPFDVLRSVKLMKKDHSLPPLTERDHLFLKNLHEEDNPVLMIVDLKKF